MSLLAWTNSNLAQTPRNALLCALFFGSAACDKDKSDSGGEDAAEEGSTESESGEETSTTGEGGEFWAVGGGGEMLRVSETAIVDGYELGLDEAPDLNGIACRGLDEAWVVGDKGLVLRTEDGGGDWRVIETPVQAPLYAVAVSLADYAWAAGEGTVLHSTDDGESWIAHPSASAAPYRAISAEETGVVAFAADANGALWRFTPEQAELRLQDEHALNDVAVSAHGEHVLAAGEAATAWVSHDGGDNFAALELPTQLGGANAVNFYAVSISQDGERAALVGDKGVVVLIDEGSTRVLHPAGPDAVLRDVHGDAQHGIQIVGEGGLLITSPDDGSSWTRLQSESALHLYGIDSIDGRGHH